MFEVENSFVVLGEASESEEDDATPHIEEDSNRSIERTSIPVIVTGEASESDNESAGDYAVTTEAFKSRAEEVLYDSLLHRKLHESNAKLKEDISNVVDGSLKFAVENINKINQKLLLNQIEIQETIKHLKRTSLLSDKIDSRICCVLKQNHLPSVNLF